MKHATIIVTYNPIKEQLFELVAEISKSKSSIIIFDNTESEESGITEDDFKESVTVLTERNNLGIAKAQNIAIQEAKNINAELLFFFDQDSRLGVNFYPRMEQLFANNKEMVAVPTIVDKETNYKYPIVTLNRWGFAQKNVLLPLHSITPIHVIISSGSVIPMDVFNKVGLMSEKYYIDFVDTEWGLRCLYNKVPIVVATNVFLYHKIGKQLKKVLFFHISVHSNLRTYYKVRNSFIFFREKHIPFLFRCKELIASISFNFVSILLSKEIVSHFKYYCLGIRDGIFFKHGKISDKYAN